MSDSEDEGAFASADEGESPQVQKSEEKKGKKPVKELKKGKAQQGDSSAAAEKVSPPASTRNQKGKGKQQQQADSRQKKKGKGEPSPQKSKEPQKVTPPSGATGSDKSSSPIAADGDKTVKAEVPDKGKKESTETVATKAADVVDKEPKSTKAAETGKEEKESGKEQEESKPTAASASSPPSQSMTRKLGKQEERDAAVAKELKESGAESQETTNQSTGSGWGWGGWGSSLLSAASNSVQTFTDQLGDGLTTIIDSVESSLGVPEPGEMARVNATVGEESPSTSEDTMKADKASPKDDEPKAGEVKTTKDIEVKETETVLEEGKTEDTGGGGGGGGGGWFSSWGVSDLAKKVQDTGKSLASKGQTLMTEGFDAVENLASGGIDVLESIGKKTYSTLSEHDPAFKKTREYLKAKNSKPNLSSMLREAKEQAEVDTAMMKEKEESRKAHFETQFDEYQGIAHLEALEILSNQSEKKVHTLLNSMSSDDLKAIKPILISIKEVFEVDEQEDSAEDGNEQDFSSLVNKYVSELELGTGPDKLNKVHEMVKQWVVDFDTHESNDKELPKTVHQQAIQSLAELTSKGVEQFHKAGELVLMQRESERDCKERAHSFARLTGVLCHEIRNLATKFTDCLHKTAAAEEDSDITALATNVYLEATNSSTYIQDAFQLLLPILQQAAIEQTVLSRQS